MHKSCAQNLRWLPGTQFTCFNSTKVQILTQNVVLQCKAAALVATQKHDDAIATLKHGLALCPNDLNLKQALLNLGVMHKDTLEKPIAASSSSNSQKSKKRDRAGEGAGLEDLEAGLHTADDGKDEKKGKDERLKPEEGVEETESQEEGMTDVDDSREVSGNDVSVM